MEEEKWRFGSSPGSCGVGLLGSFLTPGRTQDCNLSLSSFQRHNAAAYGTSGLSTSLPSSSSDARALPTSMHPRPCRSNVSQSPGVDYHLLPQPQRAKSAYVGVFRHAPCTRGFKDMLWEPTFSAARPALTQLDLARQMRFRARHVDQHELQMLPALLYKEYKARGRGGVATAEDLSDEYQVEYSAMSDADGNLHQAKEEHDRDRCVICIELFTPWDIVRELPKCKHVFHKRCIDLWLRGVCSFEACYTRSCPTCKTPLDFADSESPEDSMLSSSPSAIASSYMSAMSGHMSAHGGGAASGQDNSKGNGNGGGLMSMLCAAAPQIPRWAYARAGDALLRNSTVASHGSAPPCCDQLSRALQ